VGIETESLEAEGDCLSDSEDWVFQEVPEVDEGALEAFPRSVTVGEGSDQQSRLLPYLPVIVAEQVARVLQEVVIQHLVQTFLVADQLVQGY